MNNVSNLEAMTLIQHVDTKNIPYDANAKPDHHSLSSDTENSYEFFLHYPDKKEKNVNNDNNYAELQKQDYIQNRSYDKQDWFAIFDEDNKEGYIKYGKLGLNKDRDLTLNQYAIVDINNKKIFIPEGYAIALRRTGVVVLVHRTKDNVTSIPIAQMKCLSLNNHEITPRPKSMVCDLKDNNPDKYLTTNCKKTKENNYKEIEIKYSKNMQYAVEIMHMSDALNETKNIFS